MPPETRAADLMVDHSPPALQSLPLPLSHRAFFTLSTWSRVRAFQPLFKGLSLRDGDKRPEGHTLGAGGAAELEFCPAPPHRLGKGPQRLPCLHTNLGSFISSRLLPPTNSPCASSAVFMNTAIPIAAVLIVSGSFLRLPVRVGRAGWGRLSGVRGAEGLAFLHRGFGRWAQQQD